MCFCLIRKKCHSIVCRKNSSVLHEKTPYSCKMCFCKIFCKKNATECHSYRISRIKIQKNFIHPQKNDLLCWGQKMSLWNKRRETLTEPAHRLRPLREPQQDQDGGRITKRFRNTGQPKTRTEETTSVLYKYPSVETLRGVFVSSGSGTITAVGAAVIILSTPCSVNPQVFVAHIQTQGATLGADDLTLSLSGSGSRRGTFCCFNTYSTHRKDSDPFPILQGKNRTPPGFTSGTRSVQESRMWLVRSCLQLIHVVSTRQISELNAEARC